MQYPQDYIGKIIQGDCLEVMQGIPDGAVDMCWTDPPYNVKKDYGAYKDNLPEAEYLEWCREFISEMKRVSKNRIVIFVPTKHKLFYWNILGKDYQEILLTWSPEGTYRGKFVNQFSTLLTNIDPVKYTKNVWHNRQMSGLGWFFRENTYGHPGYTSEDISRCVLSSFGLPGQVVLDIFGGTGTTAAIAVQLGMKYILSELDPGYCAIARRRVAQAQEQQDMFRPKVQDAQSTLL